MQFAIPARWAVGVVLGLCLVRTGSAAELSLPALARQADRIYAGTVRETICGRDAKSGLVFTEVRFVDLEVFKGRGSASLRVAGGRDSDGTFVQVDGVPRFHKGERYLIFEKQGAGNICPLVGWDQGCYRLARDGNRGRVVMDGRDAPILGLRDGRIERPRPPRASEAQNLFGAAVPSVSRPSAVASPEVTRYTGSAGRRMAHAARPAVPRGAMPAADFLGALRRALRKG